MKKCSNCLEYKEYNNFWEDKYNPDGLCSQCNLCKTRLSEKRHETYIKHKDNILKSNMLYYNKNKQYINSNRKKYSKEYYLKQKDNKNRRYSIYKSSAKRKSLEFSLSHNEFNDLYQKPCNYCGSKSKGIDRIDNNYGYFIDNCVSCCKICNKTKQTMSLNEWYKYLYQIIIYNKYNNTRIINREVKHKFSILSQYKNYCRSAKRRKKRFSLSFDEFKLFFEIPCNYCGTITEGIIGLDRVDNNIGYIINNCVSCCKTCNIGKNNMEINIWNNWINIIIDFNLGALNA